MSSKLLLIQAGKDAELESTLFEREDAGSAVTYLDGEQSAPEGLNTSQAVKKRLSLQMKISGSDDVVFDVNDAKGPSVGFSLPLSRALIQQTGVGEKAFKARTVSRLFAALASELTSSVAPLAAPSRGAARETNAKRRAGKEPLWSRAAEARRLQNEAERAMLILNGFLSLAEQDPHAGFSHLRLQSLLHRKVKGHQTSYPDREIHLQRHSCPLALGHPDRVELALSLLLNNDERYTPPSRPLEVGCFDGRGTCSIALLDNSSEEHMERYLGPWDLYDPNQSDAPEAAGAAIGLSVGRQLVESMDGQLWCGRRKKGGIAFIISLPRAETGSRRKGDVIKVTRNQALHHASQRHQVQWMRD